MSLIIAGEGIQNQHNKDYMSSEHFFIILPLRYTYTAFMKTVGMSQIPLRVNCKFQLLFLNLPNLCLVIITIPIILLRRYLTICSFDYERHRANIIYATVMVKVAHHMISTNMEQRPNLLDCKAITNLIEFIFWLNTLQSMHNLHVLKIIIDK